MYSDHFPVLLNEVVEMLVTDLEGTYIDCTLGFGGHSSAILKKINKKGFLIGLDLDPYALNKSREKLQEIAPSVKSGLFLVPKVIEGEN